MRNTLVIASCLLAVAIPLSGADLQSSGVVVEINGAKITLADLDQKRAASMFQARSNYYEAARRTLEEFIDQHLIEQQARKEGVTVDQLLERHVNSKIPKDPSEETLRVYYEGVETTEPFEALRDKIVDGLRQRRIAKAKAAYLQTLRNDANIIVRLPAPRAPISMRQTPVRGPANAPITLLEYADYECPYCQQVQPILEKLASEFRGTLAFAYKDFPLPMHPNAQKAAEAARCAEVQGKYWDYHDKLIATKQLEPTALKAHARDLKMDAGAFDKCLDTGEKAGAVASHQAEAQALGLQGTPTFFVNGRYVTGALTYERLRTIIVEELSILGEGTVLSGAVGSAARKD